MTVRQHIIDLGEVGRFFAFLRNHGVVHADVGIAPRTATIGWADVGQRVDVSDFPSFPMAQ